MADATAWLSAPIHATASDWSTRVQSNGGAAPSANTLVSISNFCGALDAASIRSLMVAVNVFAPDNLIASITPLIKDAGNDPWTNANFVAADITSQGLKGNGTSKSLDSGVLPNGSFAIGDFGLSIYNTFADNTASVFEIYIGGGSPTGIASSASSQALFDAFNATLGRTTSSTPLSFGLGFTSGNRTGASAASIYAANSLNAFSSIGSSVTTNASNPPNLSLLVFATNTGGGVAGSWSKKRLSFAAIHHGLSSAQCQALFSAVQALRQAFGGGWL